MQFSSNLLQVLSTHYEPGVYLLIVVQSKPVLKQMAPAYEKFYTLWYMAPLKYVGRNL